MRLKPCKIDANAKSQVTFKNWPIDTYAWVKKIDKNFDALLKVAAELEKWNEDAFKQSIGAKTQIQSSKYADVDEDLLSLLRNVTDGDARGMVDAATCSGEAWWRMQERFYSKASQGATAVSDAISATKRPASINDSHNKLTQLKKLFKEFERNLLLNHCRRR